MTSPLIRAMANTLVDHDVDPLDDYAVITRLVAAGFAAKEIRVHYDAVVMMAMIRVTNRERQSQ